MTATTLRQLDRTRQPGSALLGAGWYAPTQGAQSQVGVIGVTFSESNLIDGQDSRPTSIGGAETVSGDFTP